MKVLAKLYYLGGMEGFGHTSPITGQSYVFPSSSVPAKITDERDVVFYGKHESFRVEPVKEKAEEGVKEVFPEPVAQEVALKPDVTEASKEKKSSIKKKE